MKKLTKDAQGFVKGVVSYISSKSTPTVVPRLASLLQKVSSQAKTERHARVYSSVRLTKGETQDIAHMLTKLLEHPVEIENTIDKDIVGGLRIQVADWVLDSSLRYQLETMTKSLYGPY